MLRGCGRLILMKNTHIVADVIHSILHQGNRSAFATFAVQNYLRNLSQPHVTNTNIQNFLDTGTGIVEKYHHDLISQTDPC